MKKSSKGYVAIIAAMFIPLIFSFFYLNMYMSEIKHDQSIFDNAVKQTALRVARQRLHHLDGNQEQTNHLNRIAAITFNDWMKVKSSIDKNIFSIKVNDVTYGARQRSEFRHYSSKNGGSYGWCSQRHWLWSNYVEDFYDNYDPDGERVVDYVSVNDSSSDFNAEGYALSNLMTGAPSITKTICQSTTSNIKITNDDDENIQVEATAKFGKYNKTYKATYKASPPKLNADIVLCIPVNSAACNTCNDPYATEDQIDNLYSNSTDYYHNAARDTPIWQIKTAFRQFMRQIIGYTECGVGIIPYSGNVAIHGWDYFDKKTIPFDGFHYANYDAVNPQVPVAESFKFATHEDYHLSINKDTEHANWGPSQRSFTPLIYRSDINGMLESYMNGNSDGSDVLKSLYSLVYQNTKFMRRAVDINPCGNINVLAGYSIRKENSYPHPYPMLGIIDKTSEPYRYLTTFMPFADHSNKSNFLYLPLMFGASMLLNSFGMLNYYFVENAKNRKKCLILVDNMGDLFAPHELTYFGMSNDASYLTLVNGERLDYESGDLELVDGYYKNKIHDCSNKTHSERIAIKCNYTKDSTNSTYTLKTPQPGNIKIVVQTVDNHQVHAKLSQDNLHAPDVKISSVTKADGDETLAITDNYYTCNLNTSYKITFENIENRKSPVIARLELIECEIESLVSLDNKYVLRQDENYVYICYGDDAYINGIESCDSSLDQNTVIIKFKQATEVTDYLTLSYVGQAFLDSSVYFSPGTQTYVLGNVYNAVLDGSMNIGGNISSSYKQNGENVFYTGYSQYYCPESSVYYSIDKYDVEELCRLCLSNAGRPDIFSDSWKELASDWVYGNDNWYGFSDISDSSTLSDISAEYGGGDNLAPNHSPEGESFPQIKIYKTNQYNNVVVNDVYTYTEGCFVADMGDYFNIYSILGNYPSFDITISNTEQAKSVYAKMQTFGFDVNIYDSSTGVSWRQDNDYIYMCYQGELYYDSDSTGYIYGITTNECDSSIFQSTNNIDGLLSNAPDVKGCTCGGGMINGNKYTHIVKNNNSTGSFGCNLSANNVNVEVVNLCDGYECSSDYLENVSGDIFHGIDATGESTNSLYCDISFNDDIRTYSGCEFPIVSSIIFSSYGSPLSITECNDVTHNNTTSSDRYTHSIVLNSVDEKSCIIHVSCDDYINKDTSIQFGDNYPNYESSYIDSDDISHSVRAYYSTSYTYDSVMFKYLDRVIACTHTPDSFYGEAESIMLITSSNIQETTISREYKSAEKGDKIPVPYAIVYKKPWHYVSSEEGNALTDEYETVDSVYISDSSLPACILESSNIDGENNAGWKCYAPDGLTYNTEKKEWELNADRLSSKYTINLIDDVPYPVLAKIKCFNVNIPGSENDADNQDNVLIRQDGEYYYVCNRTSVDTELTSGISTADISFYPSTDLKEYKKLPLSYANMRLLSAGDTDSESFTFIPETKNPYVVYSYNCNLNASASYSDTINNTSYTIDNLVTGLNVYASHVVSNIKTYSGCTYHDYFLSYKNTPDDAIFDSSAIISSISASKYQDKYREFKTIDSNYSITLSSSKPSYSTSYALTSGYNVIYIPRQGDKDTTWGSADTFDLNIGLNNAKICSIEWSNHLNGTEGCYPCKSPDGYGATDDSGNLAVYYEPIKKGKNCRWVDCTLNEQENKEDLSNFKLTDGNIVVGSFDVSISEIPFLWKSINNESDVLDSGIYKDLTGIWHLKGFNHNDKRVAIFAEINESAVSHGDFNFILNNAYGVSNVDVWFAHHYKSYENKDDEGNKDGSLIYYYNCMNGVGRYFQPTHTNAYNMLNGFDSITLCARIATPADQLILSSIECTNEVNRILMASGIQSLDSSDLPNISPTQALKKDVTPNMIKTVKSELGANGRIYVIHYRKEGQDEDPNTLHLDNSNSSNDGNSGCQIIDYGARNLDELNKVMSDILTDIKKFAGSTDAQIIE